MRKLSLTLLAIAVLSLLGRRLILVSAVEGRDQCRQQIRQMAAACELYASDNSGLYPHSLDKLVPDYLSSLPDCPVPSAGRSRYQYAQNTEPNVFTLCCQGDRHALAGVKPSIHQPHLWWNHDAQLAIRDADANGVGHLDAQPDPSQGQSRFD